MSEARVAFYFGEYIGDNGPHPNQDRIVDFASKIAAWRSMGITVDVLVADGEPQPAGNTPPTVLRYTNPRYDHKDIFALHEQQEPGRGDVWDYDLVVDQYYNGMHYQPDPENQPNLLVPQGIGFQGHDLARVINPFVVQRFADKKRTEREILKPLHLTIDSYDINELDQLNNTWGDVPLFVKPSSGANSTDIHQPQTRRELDELIAAGRVRSGHIIQPHINTNLPLEGLVAYDRTKQAELDSIQKDPTILKEVRNHIFVQSKSAGPEIKILPTLRISRPNARFMELYGVSQLISLARESLPIDSEWHQQLTVAAKTLYDKASTDADRAPLNFMFVADEINAGLPNGERRQLIGELNTRFPHLPKEAVLAQKEYVRFIAETALRNAARRG